MGRSTKSHVTEHDDWDVYTLTNVLSGWMKPVFAAHLGLENHFAKEVVLFALQAQQARTFRAKSFVPSEFEVSV